MTRKQLELREKANICRYVYQNSCTCLEYIMQLYNRIPDIGGAYKSLFRYRSLNNYELDGLENETIFMRWPSTYSDNEDCKPVIDYEEVSKYILKKKYSGWNADKIYEKLEIRKEIDRNPKVTSKINEMRNMQMITCFTERYNNDRMWEQYANHNEGICLVYNMKDILDIVKQNELFDFMPIRYVAKRDSCKDMQLNHDDLLGDNEKDYLKYALSCNTKDRLKYSFEEEWRLIYDLEKKDEAESGLNIPFVNPKVILLGGKVNTNSLEYKKLLDIASQKHIRVV